MISITYHIDVFNHSDENVLIGISTIDGHLHHLRSCILRHYRQPKRLVIIRQMREEARVNGEDFETKEKTECWWRTKKFNFVTHVLGIATHDAITPPHFKTHMGTYRTTIQWLYAILQGFMLFCMLMMLYYMLYCMLLHCRSACCTVCNNVAVLLAVLFDHSIPSHSTSSAYWQT